MLGSPGYGTAETPALTFPEFGTIRDTQPWDRIARDNAPKLTGGHVPDLRKLADAFRKWCGEKSVKPDAVSIEKTFAQRPFAVMPIDQLARFAQLVGVVAARLGAVYCISHTVT